MAIEIIYNQNLYIFEVLVFLVSITALTFMAVVFLCGLRAEDLLQ
jgi:hypothetical protein